MLVKFAMYEVEDLSRQVAFRVTSLFIDSTSQVNAIWEPESTLMIRGCSHPQWTGEVRWSLAMLLLLDQ